MKNSFLHHNLIASIVFGLLIALSGTVVAQQSAQDVYNQAVKDYNAGNLDQAKTGFEKVLKVNPRYVYARKYLAAINQKKASGDTSGATIEPKVAQIVLPSVEFKQAALKDVLTYLSQKAEEATGGSFAPNFVYRGSEEQAAQPVTLNLRNIPMTDIIRYVGQLTNTNFSYDKYAVIGTPAAPGGGSTPVQNAAKDGEAAASSILKTFD